MRASASAEITPLGATVRSTTPIVVERVTFTPATEHDRRSGLLGWVRVEIGGVVVIDSVAVRRTRRGRIALSFHVSTTRAGRRRAIAHPIDRAAHVEIERQVVAELRRQGRLAS